MNVYETIAAVAAELAAVGIAKNSKNTMQGFNFRGIDAVYNTLAPLLAKHQLCILPRCVERECVERVSSNNNALFYVTVKAEFDIVAADGTKHTVSTYGEAMDSGDKATNKAMSAAYKYAAFQTFCIPTEETAIDADATTHEVMGKFDESKFADSLAAIEEANEIKQIGDLLKAAVHAQASKDQLSKLQTAATQRKQILLGAQA